MAFSFVRAASAGGLGAAAGIVTPNPPWTTYTGTAALIGGGVLSLVPGPIGDVGDGLVDGGSALVGRSLAGVGIGLAVASLVGLGAAVVVLAVVNR